MIIDYLCNINRYTGIHPRFQNAFDYLQNNDLSNMELGKHELDSENLFVVLDKSMGRKKEDAMLELHRKYIDIQLVIDGSDKMGWEAKHKCINPSNDYDSENDIQFFKDKPSEWFTLKNGMFVIFFPEDAHLPLVGNSLIHKAIAKVKVVDS